MDFSAGAEVKAITVSTRPGLLIALVSLLATSGCDKAHVEWVEEVRLDSGQVLLAERTATGKTYSELGKPKVWARSTEMSIALREVPSGIEAPPEWQGTYVPLIIDYHAASRTWSLIATFYYCETWYELGRPVPPYVAYQSLNGSLWERVDLEQKYIGMSANLLAGPLADGESSMVTISEKEHRQRSSAPKYQKILRNWGRAELNFCDLS